jgi:MAC/Perforin domain
MRGIKNLSLAGRTSPCKAVMSVAAILLSSPVLAQQAPPAFFPAGAMYQQYGHIDLSRPQKLDIPGIEQTQHGTYQSVPYYTFIEDAASGKRYLVSDGRLKALLTLIPNSAGMRPNQDQTKHLRVAKYKVDVLRATGPLPQLSPVTLSFNDPACGDQTCFLVSGTANFAELPAGTDLFSSYLPREPQKDETSKGKQLWGSAFTPRPHYEPLYYLQGCWNVTKLPYLDYQSQKCGKKLFAELDDDSQNYDLVTGGLALPWGWYYDAETYSGSESTTTMISTSSDVMKSVKRTTGFNVSGSVDASYGFVDAEASFSYKQSQGQMQQFANMQASKSVFTQRQYHHIAWGVAVNKANLVLGAEFQNAIDYLKTRLSAGTLDDQVLTNFLGVWGTHYAYATTFGSQGSTTSSISEQQMSQMVDQGVNYSKAWDASIKIKVMGSGGSIGGGTSSEGGNENQSKYASIMQDSVETDTCTGGASCDGGTPAGEPNVPIFLDLRPISELFGPPFYKDSTTVLDLRDRVFDFIQKYAFLTLPPDKSPFDILKLTFQWPKCAVAHHCTTDEFKDLLDFTVSKGARLIPQQGSWSPLGPPNPIGFQMDFTQNFTQAQTAILLPNGTDVSLTLLRANPTQSGGPLVNSLDPFKEVRPGLRVTTPGIPVTAEPADLSKLLGFK